MHDKYIIQIIGKLSRKYWRGSFYRLQITISTETGGNTTIDAKYSTHSLSAYEIAAILVQVPTQQRIYESRQFVTGHLID